MNRCPHSSTLGLLSLTIAACATAPSQPATQAASMAAASTAAAPAAPPPSPYLARAQKVLAAPAAKDLTIMAPFPEGTTTERIEVAKGVHLRVVRRGQGRPIVFIPGWTCTADFFTHQLKGLSDKYHVLAYDPRGHGGSDKPLDGNTFRQRGADLKALLAHYNLKDAVIVGWSFGILDMYAYLKAEGTSRVAGVVVLDEPPKVWIDPQQPKAWGEIPLTADGIVFFQRAVLDAREALWRGYTAYMLGMTEAQAEGNAEVDRIVSLGMLTPDVVAIASMADGATSNYAETAKSVAQQVPTLVLAREDWADTAAQWTAREMPKAKFDRIKLHMGFATHPDEVNKRLRTFFDGLTPPKKKKR